MIITVTIIAIVINGILRSCTFWFMVVWYKRIQYLHAEQALFSYSHQSSPLGHSMCQSMWQKRTQLWNELASTFTFDYAQVYDIGFQTFSNQNNEKLFKRQFLYRCRCHFSWQTFGSPSSIHFPLSIPFPLVNTLCDTQIILHSNAPSSTGKILLHFFRLCSRYKKCFIILFVFLLMSHEYAMHNIL